MINFMFFLLFAYDAALTIFLALPVTLLYA
jgi:hypothetical protein